MIRQVLEGIEGVSIYPIISLVLFCALFIGVVYWVVRADKNYLKHMEELPLDSSNNTGENKNG